MLSDRIMDDTQQGAFSRWIPDAAYFDMLSPASQKTYHLSPPATPLSSHWLLPERSRCGSERLASHLSVSLDMRGNGRKAPPCSLALFYTQADPASVMAGAARWHLPNSRGMPLSLPSVETDRQAELS